MLKLPAALLAAWVLLVLLGVGLFRTGAVLPSGQAMSVDRAAFTAVNAATLTGFRQSIADVGQYRPIGQIAAFVLMLGGIGLSWTVGGLAMARIALLTASDLPEPRPRLAAPLPGRESGSPRPAGGAAKRGSVSIRLLVAWTAAGLAALALVGAAFGHFYGGGAWDGAFSAVSAFGNCGLRLTPAVDATQAGSHAMLLLAAVGGMGALVWFELFRPAASTLTKWILAATAGGYLLGFALLLPSYLPADFFFAKPQAAAAVAAASAGSIDARSAGFDLGLVGRSRTADWTLLGLMALGAAPGGTAGGLAVVTPVLLGLGLLRAGRGEPAGRLVAVAGVWAATFFGLVLVGQGLLLALQPQLPADRVLFLVVSALSTAGLSHDPVSAVGGGLWALTALMLLGRLLPLAFLCWAARTCNSPEQAGV